MVASEFRIEFKLTENDEPEIIPNSAMATTKRQAKRSPFGDMSASPEVLRPLKNIAMVRPLPHFFVAKSSLLHVSREIEKRKRCAGREEVVIPIGTRLAGSERVWFSYRSSHKKSFVLTRTFCSCRKKTDFIHGKIFGFICKGTYLQVCHLRWGKYAIRNFPDTTPIHNFSSHENVTDLDM